MKKPSTRGVTQSVEPTLTQCHEFKEISAKLIGGDATSELRRLESDSIQLIVTSPPYNIGKEYERKTDYAAYLENLNPIITELCRVLKPGGSICWQVGNGVRDGEIFPLDVLFYPIFKSHGLKLRNRIVWSFGHGLHARNRFSGRYETVLWFTKGDQYYFDLDSVRIPAKYPNKKHYKGPKRGLISGNPLGKNPGDVWEITNIKALHPEKTEHPCQFPTALVDRLVKSLTQPGDTVLDPFVGSGTTLVVAGANGRKSIGIEVSPKYVKIAYKRVKDFEAGSLILTTAINAKSPASAPSIVNGGSRAKRSSRII
jgi:adenine-specific DNA-methyltransferase